MTVFSGIPYKPSRVTALCLEFKANLEKLGVQDAVVLIQDPDTASFIQYTHGGTDWRYLRCTQMIKLIEKSW